MVNLMKPLLAALALQLTLHATPPEEAQELVTKGETFDKRFKPVEALKYYLPAEKLDPQNPDILLRIARQYRHEMADAPARDEKLRLGHIALDYAQRAEALAPNDSEAHLSVAISLGKMMPIMPNKEQVASSPRVKSEVDQAIKLNPDNDLAWHILGRWHRVLAEVSGLKRTLAPLIYGTLPKGSINEAAKCLERAIELNPKRLMHYIELGRVYAQQGRTADARRFIEKGLAMPSTEKDDPEAKMRGREALEKLR